MLPTREGGVNNIFRNHEKKKKCKKQMKIFFKRHKSCVIKPILLHCNETTRAIKVQVSCLRQRAEKSSIEQKLNSVIHS